MYFNCISMGQIKIGIFKSELRKANLNYNVEIYLFLNIVRNR